jgi:RNA 3'-terminal phosphate cyclase (ATP)
MRRHDVITIDGGQGEGGGQILRTSLALSLCLNLPFRIYDIRRTRRNPGLARQHLMAVKAACRIGRARVTGADIQSDTLLFEPGKVSAGDYHFDVGTAGSTSLVLQTVLPALLRAEGPSRITLIGGTHNPMAPPFEYLQSTFIPLLQRMGARVSIQLRKPGFFPAGGGEVGVEIVPGDSLRPLHLLTRGDVLEMRAVSLLAHLPEHIAERELAVIGRRLGLDDKDLAVRHLDAARCPGNVLSVTIKSERLTEVFTAFGKRGVRAEDIAAPLAEEAGEYLAAGVPVGRHLADQLLLPLVLAGGGSFHTLEPSRHTLTNASVIRRFVDTSIEIDQVDKGVWRVRM